MKIISHIFLKFNFYNALGGVVSFLIATILWYFLTRVILLTYIILIVAFILCWIIGGTIAWIMSRKFKHLAVKTYIYAIIAYIIFSWSLGDITDSSAGAWVLCSFIGFAISSFPSFLILKTQVIPSFFIPPIPQNNKKAKYNP